MNDVGACIKAINYNHVSIVETLEEKDRRGIVPARKQAQFSFTSLVLLFATAVALPVLVILL